ncbi:MAG: SsrA-binding protein SmpB [Brevinema sp.]
MSDDKKLTITAIASNKKAFHDYEVLDTFEAGISLKGTEIKSVRDGRVNLKESYVLVRGGIATLLGMNINVYDFGNIHNHKPDRERMLLLHKKEIIKLEQRSMQEGLTIIPLRMYLKGRLAKLEIGLCKGKKLFDKREKLRTDEVKRDIQRTIKAFRH